MAAYLGLDWTDGGWVGVALDDGGGYDVDVYPAISSAWTAHSDARRILIDVPIGLTDEDRRQCEVIASRYLAPHRHHSIFWTPVRAAVFSPTLAEAKRVNQRAIGRSVQTQAWRLCPRIREVDDFLALFADSAPSVVYESHPELCFWALNDAKPVRTSKHTEAGREDRLALLASEEPLSRRIYEDACETFIDPPPHARRLGTGGRADVLDALALAITAAMGGGHTDRIPYRPQIDQRDGYELPIEMVYPAVARRAEQVPLDSLPSR